uniref:Fucosyltransferase n=1 Tax=Ciona savignyi TaxID=51511 RepID=H2Y7R3_CIOSA
MFRWLKSKYGTKVFLLLTFFGSLLYIPMFISMVNRRKLEFHSDHVPYSYKKILIWGEKLPQFILNLMMYDFDNDKCGGCEVVEYANSPYVDAYTYDAVVFDFNRVTLRHDIFRRRRPDQFYVFFSAESTSALRTAHMVSMAGYENVFNLSMSYRRDSDIYAPYGTTNRTFKALKNKYGDLTTELLETRLQQKNKMALWVGSNCGFTAGAETRIDFVKKLRAILGSKLKLKGLCSDNPKEEKYGGFDNFFDDIAQYKFYFAFENSYHCKDYITEKLWENSLLSTTVPVVWGPSKKDVEELAPPNSFIHADDFYSEQALSDYLLYLDQNDTAYREYFSWWFNNETSHHRDKPVGLCQLCNLLNTSPLPRQTIRHPASWLYGQENRECTFSKRMNMPAWRTFIYLLFRRFRGLL